jgi:hypothetical protein
MKMENKMDVQEKLQKKIDAISKYVEKDGRSHLAVCSSAPSYGWDADEWHHRNAMMDIIKPITLE